jgi:hypothetical protein
MVVALAAIGCGTALVGHIIGAFKAVGVAWAQGRTGNLHAQGNLQAMLQQMNEEMARLRQSSTDVVLSYEGTLQRLEARLEHLERKALDGAAASGAVAPGAYATPAPRTASQAELAAGAR